MPTTDPMTRIATARPTPGPHSRRRFLLGVGASAAAFQITACSSGGGSGSADATGSDVSGSDAFAGTDAGNQGSDATTADTSVSDAGGDDAGEQTGDATGSAEAWATGGTVAMVAKASYRDPFEAIVSCPMVCSTTEGPCTADTEERVDVSEGFSGLPVRLLIRVVDADCVPLSGAEVKIWHTQRTGVYSGVTPSGSMCYGTDSGAVNYLYFRGTQTTDSAGVVGFDTCYPGWYSGRAIHIHFSVTVNGSEHVVSQLFFPDSLNNEIFTEHEEYSEFGTPDTTSETDNIIGGEADITPYTLSWERMSDGAMLAWKTVSVTSGGPGCSAEGAGGGGQGGPPGM